MIIFSNFTLQLVLNSILDEMRPGAGVKLYTNDAVPTPAWPVDTFTEAGFTGYAARAWVDPPLPQTRKLVDGWYQTNPVQYAWSCTGGAAERVYGLYVTTGSRVWFSLPLVESELIGPGETLRVTISLSALAQTLCST